MRTPTRKARRNSPHEARHALPNGKVLDHTGDACLSDESIASVTAQRRPIADWRDAEFACAEWMRGHGWPDATVGTGRADRGLDIISTTGVGQVKWQTKPVGRPAVQSLVGAARGQQALLFSSSGFTRGAIDWALEETVQLVQYDVLAHFTEVVTVSLTQTMKFGLDKRTGAKPVELRIDQKISSMNASSARLTDTIHRMRRQNLSWSERRRLAAAERIVIDCQPTIQKLSALYDAGKWRRAERQADELMSAFTKASKLLRTS